MTTKMETPPNYQTTKNHSDHRQYLPTGSHMDWLVEYAAKMTEPKLGEYIGRVEHRLSQMWPGTEWYYPREVKDETLDLFIKVVSFYIEHGHPEIEFSNDFRTIKKVIVEPVKFVKNKPLHDVARLNNL